MGSVLEAIEDNGRSKVEKWLIHLSGGCVGVQHVILRQAMSYLQGNFKMRDS